MTWTKEPNVCESCSTLIDFEELYRAHAGRLWLYVRKRGVRAAECEDVVQEVFLRAFRGRRLFRGDSSALQWLFGVATRVSSGCFHKNRSLGSIVASVDILENRPSDASSPLESAELQELMAMLERSFDLAGPACRELILGEDLEHSASSGGATARSLRIGTLWVKRHRARKRVRALLTKLQASRRMPFEPGEDRRRATP